jgi:uridine monophosphate synthetase
LSKSFFEFLEERSKQIDSLLCVGLDPHIVDLTEPTAAAAREFCLRIIEGSAEFAAAFKPNSAFFEVFGAEGFRVLQEVIAAVPDGIPVILDAKRGDIGSTAQAYALGAFQTLGANAITVNPYLGSDSVEPFLEDPTKGVFVLCKTSNPGAAELQDKLIDGEPLYKRVAHLAQSWKKHNNVGLVVGATFPETLANIRDENPNLWFLAPGIGAQGGNLGESLAAGLRDDGLGMLIPISRAISQSDNPNEATREWRDKINIGRKNVQKSIKIRNSQLADDLLRLGCVKFGEFKLKSGQISPFYIDLRRLAGDPRTLAKTASAYVEILKDLEFDRIAGIPYAALPIATAISLQTGKPLIYPRKEDKEYGTKASIEGIYTAGETAVVIDDLITTGRSKLETIQKLSAAGLKVRDIVVLIDRQAIFSELAETGIRLHSIFRIRELFDHWHKSGAINSKQFQQAIDFLKN